MTKSERVSSFDGTRWQLANDPQPGASGGGETEACVVVNLDGSGFYDYEGRGTITY